MLNRRRVDKTDVCILVVLLSHVMEDICQTSNNKNVCIFLVYQHETSHCCGSSKQSLFNSDLMFCLLVNVNWIQDILILDFPQNIQVFFLFFIIIYLKLRLQHSNKYKYMKLIYVGLTETQFIIR